MFGLSFVRINRFKFEFKKVVNGPTLEELMRCQYSRPDSLEDIPRASFRLEYYKEPLEILVWGVEVAPHIEGIPYRSIIVKGTFGCGIHVLLLYSPTERTGYVLEIAESDVSSVRSGYMRLVYHCAKICHRKGLHCG